MRESYMLCCGFEYNQDCKSTLDGWTTPTSDGQPLIKKYTARGVMGRDYRNKERQKERSFGLMRVEIIAMSAGEQLDG